MLPGDRAALGPLEIDLGDLVVLEHGDALLADVDRDDQLALRRRQRRAARRLAAAAVRSRSPSGGVPAAATRPCCSGGLRSRAPASSPASARLRSRQRPASAPVAAAPGFLRLRPPRLPRRRLGFVGSVVAPAAVRAAARGWDYCGRAVASTGGAAGSAAATSDSLLPSTEPGQAKTPSMARRAASQRCELHRGARSWL